MSTISARYNIVIDRAICAPGHGKSKIDSQNGRDKCILNKAMCCLINPEAAKSVSDSVISTEPEKQSANDVSETKVKTEIKPSKLSLRFMEVHDSVGDSGASLAESAVKILNNLSRVHGVKDRKSQKRQANSYFLCQNYLIQNKNDATLTAINMTWNNSLFPKLPESGNSAPIRGKCGVMTHYHYRLDPKLGEGVCAIHCIPCACAACVQQLQLPWDPKLSHASKQPRYQSAQECVYQSILGSFNDWIIMPFQNKSTSEETFEEVHKIVLNGMTESKAELIFADGYGAVAADDVKTAGYYIVRFTSPAYTLQEAHTSKEGDTFDVGELVADAVYLYPISKKGPKIPSEAKPIWYVESNLHTDAIKVALHTVVVPNLNLFPVTNKNMLQGPVRSLSKKDMELQKPVCLDFEQHHQILDESVRLHRQEYNMFSAKNKDDEDPNSDEEVEIYQH